MNEIKKQNKRLILLQRNLLWKTHEIPKTKSISKCKTKTINNSGLTLKEGKNYGIIEGILLCKNAKCPSCFYLRSKEYKHKLLSVIETTNINHSENQYLFITLTVEHKKYSSLEKILKGLSSAKTNFLKNTISVNKRIEILWHFSRLEFSFGKNGIHPHYHLLLSVKNWNSTLENQLKMHWHKSISKQNLRSNKENGIDIIKIKSNSNDLEKIPNYLTKNKDHPKEKKNKVYDKIFEKMGSTKSKFKNNRSLGQLIDNLEKEDLDFDFSLGESFSLIKRFYQGASSRSIFQASNSFSKILENLEDVSTEEEELIFDNHIENKSIQEIHIPQYIYDRIVGSDNQFIINDFIVHNQLDLVVKQIEKLYGREQLIVIQTNDGHQIKLFNSYSD